MVKKTWRKRFTAFMSTPKRYSHASPDIIVAPQMDSLGSSFRLQRGRYGLRRMPCYESIKVAHADKDDTEGCQRVRNVAADKIWADIAYMANLASSN
jgi:hypothetical protein